MDTTNSITTKLIVDDAQAHKAFVRMNGDLETLIQFGSKAGKTVQGFTKISEAATGTRRQIEATTKASIKMNAVIAGRNQAGVSSLFGETQTQSAQKFAAGFGDYNAQITKSTKAMDNLNKQQKINNSLMNKTVKGLKSGQEAFVGFNGAMLSTLFFGMALKTTMTSALTAVFEGYKKIIPESHAFNKLTTRLTANWEFFKFQLADIIANSPVFIWLINGIISVIKAFQKMPDWMKWSTVALIAIGAAVGGLLLFVAILSLGAAGLVDLGVGVGVFETLDGKITKVNTSLFVTLGRTLLILAAFTLLAVSITKFGDSSDYSKDKMDNLGEGFLGVMNSIIIPLAEAFGVANLEIVDLGGAMVVLGALMTTALAAIGQSLGFFVVIIRGAWNIVEMILQLIANAFIDKAKDILTALSWLTKAYDYVFNKNLTESVNSGISALESLQFTTQDFVSDFKDIGDAFDDFTSNADKLNDAMVNPLTALEEYNKGLDTLEQKKKSAAFMDTLLNPDIAMSVIPKTGATTGTTINNILQIDGASLSTDIGNSLNNIVSEVKTEIGFDDTFGSGQ